MPMPMLIRSRTYDQTSFGEMRSQTGVADEDLALVLG